MKDEMGRVVRVELACRVWVEEGKTIDAELVEENVAASLGMWGFDLVDWEVFDETPEVNEEPA